MLKPWCGTAIPGRLCSTPSSNALAGAYVTFPFSAVDVFGVRARVPVKARFDDAVDYSGSLTPYGGQHRLGVRKDIHKSLGKTRGDNVHVRVILDRDRADVAGND